MEQVKALDALEPFLALCKSATSPRAAAEIVTRATSSPNAFLFTELLETPQIRDLANSAEYAPFLTLLQIFSYGTYSDYRKHTAPDDNSSSSSTGLPALNGAQTLKLRQLSILSLAKHKENLTYEALSRQLGLADTRELEDTVISAVYAGLVSATLDPAHRAVLVSSVAPLRDLAPGSVPGLLAALRAWSGRCGDTLASLGAQVRDIGERAADRAREDAAREKLLVQAVDDEKATVEAGGGPGKKPMTLTTGHGAGGGGGRPLRFGKRGSNLMMESSVVDVDYEAMDVDDDDEGTEGKKRASRRKL